MTHTPVIKQVAAWLDSSSLGVAFTGAGISTESGIPDFRSPQGVWAKYQPVYYDEFLSSADARTRYWQQKSEGHRDFADAAPNVAHQLLAQWQSEGHLRGVITQNIDGLHQIAGSGGVLELHGTARDVRCLECDYRSPSGEFVDGFLASQTVPDCPACGGLLKHATISFGQSLPAEILAKATQWCREADFMLAMGSSLVVTPAAELPLVAKRAGARLVIVNRDPTPLDELADAVIHASIGETMKQIQGLRSENSQPDAE